MARAVPAYKPTTSMSSLIEVRKRHGVHNRSQTFWTAHNLYCLGLVERLLPIARLGDKADFCLLPRRPH